MSNRQRNWYKLCLYSPAYYRGGIHYYFHETVIGLYKNLASAKRRIRQIIADAWYYNGDFVVKCKGKVVYNRAT